MSERILFGNLGNPVDATKRALDQIDRLDKRVEAWIEVDREGALDQAMEIASNMEALRLPLFGVPVGLKDIIDVADIPTRLGTRPFAHYTPAVDSVVVEKLRAAGAIILGKTATTEFAHRDPAATRNPWNLEHTPGGSSSGSAAAVAAGMVPLALGSQTIGSTLRPAAFCGIVGLKPTHGRISLRGLYPLVPSFDHVGILCRSVLEAATALGVLAGYDEDDPWSLDEPVEDYVAAVAHYDGRPRIGLARGDYASGAEEPVRSHLDAVAERLRAAGAEVVEVELPATAQQVFDTGYPMFRAEAATAHADLFARHRDDYGSNMRETLDAGLQIRAVDYARAREALVRLRRPFEQALSAFDAVLLPSCPTPAPRGLDQTGSAGYCAPASMLGLPAINLPSGLTDDGLPLGVQLVAGRLQESRLLAAAGWVERVLDFRAKPPLLTES